MKNSHSIPSHSFNKVVDHVQESVKDAHLSLDLAMPFILTRLECMKGISQVDYAHRHDCYEVLFITAGEGTHFIDLQAYPIKPPMFFLLSKEKVHALQVVKPLQGYVLFFTEAFLGFSSSNIILSQDFSIFHATNMTPCLPIPASQLANINGLLSDIAQEFHHPAQSISVLRAYLHILLTHVHRLSDMQCPEEACNKSSSLVRQFKQLLAEHVVTEHAVQDYAKRMKISTRYLKDTVKAVTGSAPGSIIRETLINEAKRLLAHTNLSVAEISYYLNFEDTSYFGRFFKRETGMSPIAFRQQVRDQ